MLYLALRFLNYLLLTRLCKFFISFILMLKTATLGLPCTSFEISNLNISICHHVYSIRVAKLSEPARRMRKLAATGEQRSY